MRTLILIPTETEAALLRAACPDAPVRIAGVGMAAAAAATARIIAEEHPDRLILAGIAGASDRSVAVCEVVAVAGERIAELPGKYAVRYAADFIPAGLRTVESNTTNRTGVAASGTQIENMEGAAFLAVCRAFGVPGAEVRAVSNYTDDPRSAWRIEESAEKLAKKSFEYFRIMNKKWIIYIVLIVVAFVLIVVFSKNIYFWLSNQLWKILLLAAVFGGGWLLGRFGGKKNGTQQGNGN